MHVMFRLTPLMTGVLLLAAAPWAGAESPLPDPIAPAVIGPPLDQIRPARPHHKAVAAKPKQHTVVATSRKAVHPHPTERVAAVRAPAQPVPEPHYVWLRPAQTAQIAQPAQAAQLPQAAQQPTQFLGRFSTKDEELVRRYYETHPVSGQVVRWKIGEPIPPKSVLTGVPDDLRAALSKLPAGHQYVQVDGDVVLVAVQSRVVVDGISRGAH